MGTPSDSAQINVEEPPIRKNASLGLWPSIDRHSDRVGTIGSLAKPSGPVAIASHKGMQHRGEGRLHGRTCQGEARAFATFKAKLKQIQSLTKTPLGQLRAETFSRQAYDHHTRTKYNVCPWNRSYYSCGQL